MSVTASQLLIIYQARKIGWESGQLKYNDSLYHAVCYLVDNLQNQAPNDIIEFEKAENGNPIFRCNGIEVGRFPINEFDV